MLRKLFCLSLFFSFILSAQLESNAAVLDAKLKDLRGQELSLNIYKGKPVMLFFWTTWCPYCRREIKELNQISSQLSKQGLNVFAINTGEPANKVEKFFKDFPLNLKVLLDSEAKFADSEDIAGVPTYILIDKKGNEVSREHVFPKDYQALILK